MASIIQCAGKCLSAIEDALVKTIYSRYPLGSFLPALVNTPSLDGESNCKRKCLTHLLKESFLWAVPKKRRSIEKRRSRRFGIPEYFYKPLVPKTNIIICSECGSYKEAGLLCPNCYSKVQETTKQMQEAIKEALGIAPVEAEVVVLNPDEENENPEFFKGKRIVEMKKQGPKIFSDNLLQKSTQSSATSNNIIQKKEIS